MPYQQCVRCNSVLKQSERNFKLQISTRKYNKTCLGCCQYYALRRMRKASVPPGVVKNEKKSAEQSG